MGDLYQGLRDYPKNIFYEILAGRSKDLTVFGQPYPKQEADRAPQKNGRRVYERTILWPAPRPGGGLTIVPAWDTLATCPECEKRRRELEKDYLDAHGLESALLEWESYSPILEKDGEYVCSECGLVIEPDRDLEQLSEEDLRNATKHVGDRKKYIESNKAELFEQWKKEWDNIPLEIRQLGEQMADAERQYDLRAENAKRERAELLRKRPKVHRTEMPNVYVIDEITIPHPVLAGKTLCIQNDFIY